MSVLGAEAGPLMVVNQPFELFASACPVKFRIAVA